MEFNSREHYLKFLQNKINTLSNSEEYNFFVHITSVINDDRFFHSTKTDKEIAINKMQSILRNGIDLNRNYIYRYSAMSGTTNFLGNSNNIDANDIIDYVYDANPEFYRCVAILAVPKYIHIDNKEVEFSSYKNLANFKFIKSEADKQVADELAKVYSEKAVDYNDNHHTKLSLLDCILGSNIPKEFILGYEEVDPSNNIYAFVENEKHISNMNKETRDKFENLCADQIKRVGYDPVQDNKLEIFVKKTKSDKDYLDVLMYEDI